ncbi:hypothetical protein GCM10012289_61700 [Nonomuraea cavernae]|uniref:Uncharacterized protein n=1 Tax=Nonomuraea cavernae TaxID=2045107 RepID=A0A918DQL5_9ACTN|nr:hypothetical protein GCM10012289_61700 [Nonomuraea cavernae]
MTHVATARYSPVPEPQVALTVRESTMADEHPLGAAQAGCVKPGASATRIPPMAAATDVKIRVDGIRILS